MGLSFNEINAFTIGEYLDLFDAWKEIYNFGKKNMIFEIPERLDNPVSMLDMK